MQNAKLLTGNSLTQALNTWNAAGKKVVFTNGCFDVFHAGHAYILNTAKSFGDVLVVGLNSDASVNRLKGNPRPINNVEQRAYVLAALAVVDVVVVFEEDTPLQLIQQIEPHVLVKGGDYNPATVVGADNVLARGGKVEIVPLVEGLSSTKILAQR